MILAVHTVTTAAQVADALVVIAALLAWTFAAAYSRGGWRSTRPGRSVMYLVVALATVLSLGAVTSALGQEWAGRQHARAVVFAGLIVTLVGMLAALQAERRRRR